MAKRQANEVIAEIEQKWRKRCRCMLWSWSVEHLNFLVDRWAFKNPQDKERREYFRKKIDALLNRRFRTSQTMNWLYFYTDDIREMMIGAAMNVAEPKFKESVKHDRVIVLKPREPKAGVTVDERNATQRA